MSLSSLSLSCVSKRYEKKLSLEPAEFARFQVSRSEEEDCDDDADDVCDVHDGDDDADGDDPLR